MPLSEEPNSLRQIGSRGHRATLDAHGHRALDQSRIPISRLQSSILRYLFSWLEPYGTPQEQEEPTPSTPEPAAIEQSFCLSKRFPLLSRPGRRFLLSMEMPDCSRVRNRKPLKRRSRSRPCRLWHRSKETRHLLLSSCHPGCKPCAPSSRSSLITLDY